MTQFDRNNSSPETPRVENMITPIPEGYRERVGSIAETFSDAVVRCVERSGADPALIDALDSFSRAFDNRANFGSSAEPLSAQKVATLTEFFGAVGRRLHGEYPDGSYSTGFSVLHIDETSR